MAEIPIVGDTRCVQSYTNYDNTMTCAGDLVAGGLDTCQVGRQVQWPGYVLAMCPPASLHAYPNTHTCILPCVGCV